MIAYRCMYMHMHVCDSVMFSKLVKQINILID